MLAVLLSGCQQFILTLLVLKPGKIGIMCQYKGNYVPFIQNIKHLDF